MSQSRPLGGQRLWVGQFSVPQTGLQRNYWSGRKKYCSREKLQDLECCGFGIEARGPPAGWLLLPAAEDAGRATVSLRIPRRGCVPGKPESRMPCTSADFSIRGV